MAREKGELVYTIYRALSYGLTPLLHLHLRWRKLRGLEHPLRWRERLGHPSLPRPPVSKLLNKSIAGYMLTNMFNIEIGEGMAAIPVIKGCIQRRPDVNVLMTTTTLSAFEVLKNLLPNDVIYQFVLEQFAPLDTPTAMDCFLGYWKPNAIMLIESELWPNLIMGASRKCIALALLNARMSAKSFRNWSIPVVSHLTSLMLSKFSLIVPLCNMQAIYFQLLQAPPLVINFSGDLKYAVDNGNSNEVLRSMENLQVQLANRQVWMASSIHKGEEEVMLGVHKVLQKTYPDIVSVIVPRHPQLGLDIALNLQKEGVSVKLRSHHDMLTPGTNIYVVDTLGELRYFYRLTPIAVIGGSFLPGLTGHNISEAAAAGCAVLTGRHLGHFAHMALEMQRLNALSVLQVSGNAELEEVLRELFSNAKLLDARRVAAKQAFNALSSGVVEKVCNLLHLHIYSKVFTKMKDDGQEKGGGDE
ncbi:hypothetical protein RJ639_006122, partial [Escallonia herrerae]